ncbi:uncharacterized protein AB675_11578 [Cyphellophora attinorum]|uniref:Xylanolytic transcriptional activator regulatory domain-containing protein n=1 Tax=Cyphellophora attinorum TaxID=1664694 RepID=A0A0N1HQH2_9EURO|nr:uncharacterized protein AB675_11578 [Phialophora attinorum]KPI40200.1 hypothetical protein AB675_11578 [Phialophora attinorum]
MEYSLAKGQLTAAESTGAMSLQLLQAMVLLTVYEYSHAIYPAAYFGIAMCARYATALGLHQQRGRLNPVHEADLDVVEEKRRLWWSIVILDTIISAEGTACTESSSEDILPVHDRSWDTGTFTEADMYTAGSPANTNMGMFARLSQASYLLAKVIRHKSTPTHDAAFDLEERNNLQRALQSLLTLTYREGSTEYMPICPQTALCYSALVILNSSAYPGTSSVNAGSAEDLEHTVVDLLMPVADESLLSTELHYRGRPWSLDRSTPFLLRWSYLIAKTFQDILTHVGGSSESQAETVPIAGDDQQRFIRERALKGYETMRKKLLLLGSQWCAADDYLRMLDVRAGGKFG